MCINVRLTSPYISKLLWTWIREVDLYVARLSYYYSFSPNTLDSEGRDKIISVLTMCVCVCVCVCMCVCVCRESRDVCHHPFFTSVLDGSKLLAADINVYSWEWTPYLFNALALELDIYSLAHHLCKMRIFHEPSRVAFCGGINEDSERKSKKIIKYICWLNI